MHGADGKLRFFAFRASSIKRPTQEGDRPSAVDRGPLSQASRSNSLAEQRSSGTHRSIFRMNWRKRVLFLPWRFCSENSRVVGGMVMGAFQAPGFWGYLRLVGRREVRQNLGIEREGGVRCGRFWELRGSERVWKDAE